jgi:hypothetical protein
MMKYYTCDAQRLDGRFTRPPVKTSEVLVPIAPWPAIFQEAKVTGIIFYEFWHDSVEDGVAYFFRWLGEPRSTVLVIWEVDGPTHIEARKSGDLPLSAGELEPIIAEVTMLFRDAGFRPNRLLQ